MSTSAPPESGVRLAPELTSPASVMTALKAGWILSELLGRIENGSTARDRRGTRDRVSVEPSQLSQGTPSEVLGLQLGAKVRQLKPELDNACVDSAGWQRVARGLDGLVKSPLIRANELRELRADIGGALTAASSRLGNSFLLGFDLATTCRLPATAKVECVQELFGLRAVAIQQALADLSSALPDHAGRGVSLSLALWQHWAADPQLSRHSVKWPNASVGQALERQGKVWLAILSGEKLGKDMLGVADYLKAIWALIRGVASRWWVWVAVGGAVAAAAGGIYLLAAHGSTVKKIWGAALTGLGAVGIRVASLKRLLGDVAAELEHEVWGAELDLAIAGAITVPPGDWRLRVGSRAIEMPPARGVDPDYPRHARTIHVLLRRSLGRLHAPRSNRLIVNKAYGLWKGGYENTVLKSKWLRARRARRFLHEDCVYEPAPNVSATTGRGKVSRELAGLTLEGYEYEELACAPTGRIVSRHGPSGPALVWTFHHERLRAIALFDDYGAATDEARKAWSPHGGGERGDRDGDNDAALGRSSAEAAPSSRRGGAQATNGNDHRGRRGISGRRSKGAR